MGVRRHYLRTPLATVLPTLKPCAGRHLLERRHMGKQRHFVKTGPAKTCSVAKKRGQAQTLPEDRCGEDTWRREDAWHHSPMWRHGDACGVTRCGVNTWRHLPLGAQAGTTTTHHRPGKETESQEKVPLAICQRAPVVTGHGVKTWRHVPTCCQRCGVTDVSSGAVDRRGIARRGGSTSSQVVRGVPALFESSGVSRSAHPHGRPPFFSAYTCMCVYVCICTCLEGSLHSGRGLVLLNANVALSASPALSRSRSASSKSLRRRCRRPRRKKEARRKARSSSLCHGEWRACQKGYCVLGLKAWSGSDCSLAMLLAAVL